MIKEEGGSNRWFDCYPRSSSLRAPVYATCWVSSKVQKWIDSKKRKFGATQLNIFILQVEYAYPRFCVSFQMVHKTLTNAPICRPIDRECGVDRDRSGPILLNFWNWGFGQVISSWMCWFLTVYEAFVWYCTWLLVFFYYLFLSPS